MTVLAASAQEESKTKSNSMNWSLEKRFDNFDFLKPVLLGYDHDNDGNLIVNSIEANTVKLMFYSYLAGFSLAETAQLLNELGRPSKKGNIKWNSAGVRSILKNERYCGDVLSWKTYTYDFWEHKKRKNRQNRKQIRQNNHHEPIVSREVFDAVQTKMELDKYTRDPHNFPTINVVDEGILQGFVSINRSCRGFTKDDYCDASESIYYLREERKDLDRKQEKTKTHASSSFDLDGYEIVRAEFFTTLEKPTMRISNNRIKFNTMCLRKFENVEYVELLINTVEKCIAIRPCEEGNPNAFRWGTLKNDKWMPLSKSITGFAGPLFAITGWDPTDRVKLCGQYLSDGETQMLLFDLSEPEIIRLVPEEMDVDKDVNNVEKTDCDATSEGTSRACEEAEPARLEQVLPERWTNSFGRSANNNNVWYFERIQYKGDWEILRPAKQFSIAGNVSQHVLDKVKRETQRIIEDMRRAV